MPVESINFISDFVTTNPLADDPLRETDDHIKGVKFGVKNTFVNVSGAVTATHTELNRVAGLTGNILTTGNPRPGQLQLLANVTVSAGATVDLINGTGGVVLDTNYDEYILNVEGVSPVSTTDLRLQLSTDGGATWGAISTAELSQYQNIVSGTGTFGSLTGVTHFPVTGTLTIAGSSGVPANYPACRIVIKQRVDASTRIFIQSDMATGTQVSTATMRPANNTAFNAIRLLWGTGNFQALGNVRLWGRRFT